MHKISNKLVNFIVMGITVLIVLAAGLVGSQQVQKSMESQEINNLQDVASQNAIVMERELAARLDLLSSIAAMMQSPQLSSNETVLQALQDVPRIYGLKRIGFVRPDGMAFTTDGYTQNLSYREFFTNALRGERYVSKRLINAMGDAVPINVFSVPVFSENGQRVVGVLFATYETSTFRRIIDVPSFAGSGYCYVVDAEGNIIVDSDKSPLVGSNNLVDVWSAKGMGERKFALDIKNKLLAGQTNHVVINNEGQEKLVYYLPLKTKVHENTMYLLTIVPANTLVNRLLPVANMLRNMMIAIAGLVFISIGYIFFNIYRRDKELYNLAYVDSLTQGMNYTAFKKHWQENEHVNGYIVAFDIDHFGNISQLLGNERANALLVRIWQLLARHLHKDEFVARVDHDEFILELCATDPFQLEDRINQLGELILNLSLKENLPEVHGIFGVYAAQEVKDVDTAYYSAVLAKNTIKGRYHTYCSFYNDASVAEAKDKQQIADSFTVAMEREEFDVVYQPKISATEEKVLGAEALVRWRQKDGSLLNPGRFIPVFEDNGMIAALDEYVFRHVCEQQHSWMAAGKKLVPVSINLSRASLHVQNLVDRYLAIVQQYALNPEYLQIEITESATASIDNLDALMEKFQNAGFKLLMDDFGSGYSSLSALYRLPFDVIKLDKSLIDYVEELDGGKLVEEMIGYSHSLGKKVIAEGVESKAQLEILRHMQCDAIQGYYFDKPLLKGRFAEKYLD